MINDSDQDHNLQKDRDRDPDRFSIILWRLNLYLFRLFMSCKGYMLNYVLVGIPARVSNAENCEPAQPKPIGYIIIHVNECL